MVIARDGVCQLCGSLPSKPRVDHIVPLASGGGNEASNLRLLCLPCHRRLTPGGGG